MTGVLERIGKFKHRHTKRRMPCNTEAEVGVIYLQGKECQGLLEATRSF